MDVYFEDIDARDGWILESSIEQRGGTEVDLLPIQPMLSPILSSAGSHGFLRSVEITQKRSSGDGGGDLSWNMQLGVDNRHVGKK